MNSNSILDSVKKGLGIQPEYEHFDPEIILHINSVFSTLNQLKVGPEEGYLINDSNNEWSELGIDEKKLNMVKTYIIMSVKMIFDPPQSSAVIEAYKNKIAEFEFRMNLETDRGETYAWKKEENNENSISE